MDTQTLPRNPETHHRNGETPPDPAPPQHPPAGALSLKDLSLKELHAGLGARGVTIGYSALSELIATGDVAALLGAGGTGGRRAFPPAALETLAGFLPGFQDNGGRRPQAPILLRAHLLHGGQAVISPPADSDQVTDLAQLRNSESQLETQKPGGLAAVLGTLAGLPAALVAQTSMLRELTGFLRETRATDKTRPAPPSPPPADRLLSAEDAAALLACHPRSVSRYVPPVLPRKWKESDVLAFIAGLGGRENGAEGRPLE